MRLRVVATWIVLGLAGLVLVDCGGTGGDPAVGHSSEQSTSSCDPGTEPACQDASGDPTPAYCLADGLWSCCDPAAQPKCGSGLPECVGNAWICTPGFGTESSCTTCGRKGGGGPVL